MQYHCLQMQVAMQVQAAEHDKLDEATGGKSVMMEDTACAVTAAAVQVTSGVATSDAETQAL